MACTVQRNCVCKLDSCFLTAKVNKNNEAQALTFNATLTNLLNQLSVVAYWGDLNSTLCVKGVSEFHQYHRLP